MCFSIRRASNRWLKWFVSVDFEERMRLLSEKDQRRSQKDAQWKCLSWFTRYYSVDTYRARKRPSEKYMLWYDRSFTMHHWVRCPSRFPMPRLFNRGKDTKWTTGHGLVVHGTNTRGKKFGVTRVSFNWILGQIIAKQPKQEVQYLVNHNENSKNPDIIKGKTTVLEPENAMKF